MIKIDYPFIIKYNHACAARLIFSINCSYSPGENRLLLL